MTEGIKKPLRALFRTAMQFYPREYGKYSILMKLYFPYLAPVPPTKEVAVLSDGIRMELVLNGNCISSENLSLQRSRC
jgi:hypothetical protein